MRDAASLARVAKALYFLPRTMSVIGAIELPSVLAAYTTLCCRARRLGACFFDIGAGLSRATSDASRADSVLPWSDGN